jgi:hypothetical protein
MFPPTRSLGVIATKGSKKKATPNRNSRPTTIFAKTIVDIYKKIFTCPHNNSLNDSIDVFSDFGCNQFGET